MKVSVEHWWIYTDRKTLRYWEKKTCPIATFSTINVMWIFTGSNLVLRVERLVTNA